MNHPISRYNVAKTRQIAYLSCEVAMASIVQRSKTALSWPLPPPCMPALHRGFGVRGTFRPLQSGPVQARHLPEALVPWPRKSVQSHSRGVPRATTTNHDSI